MGWHISNLVNTVKVSKKAAKAINEWAEKEIYEEEVVRGSKLYFNPDHLEHMDFLWQDGFEELAKELKLNGEVCFGSLEGDNEGEFWGYRFKDGVMTKLSGKLVWDED